MREPLTRTLGLADEDATDRLGQQLASALGDRPAGWLMLLEGELGAGKSTLARAMLRAWGHTGAVPSPTYTLVEPYQLTRYCVYHFDLYRLGDAEELEFMGVRDYFAGDAICLIEWPERGKGVLPPADLVITIGREGSGRLLSLRAASRRGMALLQQLREGERPGDL